MSLSEPATSQLDWGFHTLRGGIDPRDPRFRRRVVGVVEAWKTLPPGDGNTSSPGSAGPRRWPEGPLSSRAGAMTPGQSTITLWGWGFHTRRGGIGPGDVRLRPRVVGVVEIWKISSPGDEDLSSPGAAGPRRWPDG